MIATFATYVRHAVHIVGLRKCADALRVGGRNILDLDHEAAP